jgi:uncharacterized protein involved in exopolysaccharide biosynthesis
MPARQQEFSMVARDRQSAKDLYDSLLKRYEEAQMAESMETDRQANASEFSKPQSLRKVRALRIVRIC